MLSREAEARLRDSLMRTLKEADQAIERAWAEGDLEALAQTGHALKGNSGAHYFGLTAVREAGAALEARFRLAKDMREVRSTAPETRGAKAEAADGEHATVEERAADPAAVVLVARRALAEAIERLEADRLTREVSGDARLDAVDGDGEADAL